MSEPPVPVHVPLPERAQRVWVIEDEPELGRLMVDYLRHGGYEAEHLLDGNTLPQRLRTPAIPAPDLLLLDLMLPGRDGLSLCAEIRGFSRIPIILVTARVDELDRLLGLDTGADDYICKPFSPREVVARVRALLRRSAYAGAGAGGTGEPAPGQWPVIEVDDDRRRIQLRLPAGQRQPLDLTDTEFRLLRALAQRPGVILSRAQLLDHSRGQEADVVDRAIDSHVKNLRRKLAAVHGEAHSCIHSVYGVGYRFEWISEPPSVSRPGR